MPCAAASPPTYGTYFFLPAKRSKQEKTLFAGKEVKQEKRNNTVCGGGTRFPATFVRSCPFLSVRGVYSRDGGLFSAAAGCRQRSSAALMQGFTAWRCQAPPRTPTLRAHRGKALRFPPTPFCRFRKESGPVCRRSFTFARPAFSGRRIVAATASLAAAMLGCTRLAF